MAPASTAHAAAPSAPAAAAAADVAERHFAVLYTKRDKWMKKSGRQFSDGVIKIVVARGGATAPGGGGGGGSSTSYVLYDGEGKSVSTGKGLKLGPAGLGGLDGGAVLELGTFVAEVDRPIAPGNFLSGACFVGAAAAVLLPGGAAGGAGAGGAGACVSLPGRAGGGGFKRPGGMGGGGSAAAGGGAGAGAGVAGATPLAPLAALPALHDPAAPDALVLNQFELDAWAARARGAAGGARKPLGSAHQNQQQQQQQRRPPTPVVLDPYLARRLRPHQREGVRFLYEATMGLRGPPDAAGGGGGGGGGPATAAAAATANGTPPTTGALLADEMGLGKTLQVIALAWTLLRQSPQGAQAGAARKVVVVAPATLTNNWAAECKKWLGDERLRVMVLSPQGSVAAGQAADFATRGSIYRLCVLSYEAARRHAPALAGCADLLVCDEAHRLKSAAGGKTVEALRALGCARRVVLTGTPFQNDMSELYALFDFACPGRLGPLPAFRRVYGDVIARAQDGGATPAERELGAARSAELRVRIRPWILRRTQAVLAAHLPPLRVLVAFCAPTALQRACYTFLLRGRGVTGVLRGGGGGGGDKGVLPAITVLRKLCNAPELLLLKTQQQAAAAAAAAGAAAADGGAADATAGGGGISDEAAAAVSRELARLRDGDHPQQHEHQHHSGKLAVLDALLSATLRAGPARARCVVVANSTGALDVVERRLLGPRGWRSARIDGATPPHLRQERVDAFNKHGVGDVFLLSTQAGGAGLNLVGASVLALYDSHWNPAVDLQAMGRIWRDGQRHPCFVFRLLTAGGIEEAIYQRQLFKNRVGRGALGAGGGGCEGDGEGAGPGEEGGGNDWGAGFAKGLSREELKRLFTFEPDAPGGCTSFARLEGVQGLRWFAAPPGVEGEGEEEGAAAARAPGDEGGAPLPPALAAAWRAGLVTAAHEETGHAAAAQQQRGPRVKLEGEAEASPPQQREQQQQQQHGGESAAAAAAAEGDVGELELRSSAEDG